MEKKLKDLTGAVSVNGDVTPTLREPITKVDANDWSEMTASELWEQKSTLMTRMAYAQQMYNPQITAQIQRGITVIDQLLAQKSKEREHDLI